MINPIPTININVSSPATSVVSIKAKAIKTGMNVPEVLSPPNTLSKTTTNAPNGTNNICLYAFCSETGNEKREKSPTLQPSLRALVYQEDILQVLDVH